MMRATLKRLFNKLKSQNIAELIRYGLVGASTTIINLLSYHLCLLVLDYKIANLIALIVSKTYGYFANKKIVFKSETKTIGSFLAEVARFIFARGITAVVDYFGLIFAVEILGCGKVVSKYVLQVLVIVINYVLGKYMVFRSKKEKEIVT